ncbi:MAG: hypothetical protein AAGD07_06845 [Planctomycetota bacterium]
MHHRSGLLAIDWPRWWQEASRATTHGGNQHGRSDNQRDEEIAIGFGP